MEKKYIKITNQIGGNVTHRMAQGRDYLVAPMVAVVSKVLNGMYLPPEEIENSILGWLGVPITKEHPEQTARHPDVPILGRFYNPAFENDSLKGEAWYDTELVRKQGEAGMELFTRLEKGELVEVSTGYFANIEMTPGEFNGEEYLAIQRDLTPDHIATLLHDLGACSVEDGCGVPRQNKKVLIAQKGEKMPKKNVLLATANALLRTLGQEEIKAEDVGDVEVPIQFINDAIPVHHTDTDGKSEWDGPGETAKAGNDEGVLFHMHAWIDSEGDPATKNSYKFPHHKAGEDTPAVMAAVRNALARLPQADIPDADRAAVEKHLQAHMDDFKEANPPEGEPEADKSKGNEAKFELPESLNAVAALVEEVGIDRVRSAIQGITANEDEERKVLISDLLKCANCQFTEKELKAMSTAVLQKMALSMTGVDYAGRGQTKQNTREDEANGMTPVYLSKKVKEPTNV